MKPIWRITFIVSIFLSSVNFVAAKPNSANFACNDSKVMLINKTNTSFSIDYTSLNDSQIALTRGSTLLSPNDVAEFKVHSAAVKTWGEYVGNIIISNETSNYQLFYFFGGFFNYGNCTVRHDISDNQNQLYKGNYLTICEEGTTRKPASLTCTVYNAAKQE